MNHEKIEIFQANAQMERVFAYRQIEMWLKQHGIAFLRMAETASLTPYAGNPYMPPPRYAVTPS